MQCNSSFSPPAPPPLSAQQLADLLTYGLVGTDKPQTTFTAQVDATNASSLWLEVDGSLPSSPFHQVSADLRSATLALGYPIAEQRVLGAMMALRSIDTKVQKVTVSLPLADVTVAEDLADLGPYLTKRAARDVRRKVLMQREYRRQQLGLSAKLPAEEIQAAIYASFILPQAQAALQQVAPGRAIQVTTQTRSQDAATGFAPLRLRADDPVSANVFALAMRTGFHGSQAPVLRRWLKLSPFQFGRNVCRAGHPSDLSQKIALAVPQICLLASIDPSPSLERTEHV